MVPQNRRKNTEDELKMRDLQRDPEGAAKLSPEDAHVLVDHECTKILKGFVRLQKKRRQRGNNNAAADDDDIEAFMASFDKMADRASELVRIREKMESHIWYA